VRENAGRLWAINSDANLGAAAAIAERELISAIQETGGALVAAKAARNITLSLSEDELAPEGYRIVSQTKRRRLHVSCVGRDERGLIYAAYDLAERIRHREPLAELDIREQPNCAMRRIFCLWPDHEALASLVRAMPRWRMNALCLFGACHQPADRPGLLIYNYEHYLSLPIAYRNYPQVNASTEGSSYFQRTRESFSQLLRVAREHRVDVFVHFAILEYVRVDDAGPHFSSARADQIKYFPHFFLAGQENPDWDSPLVWNYVRDQLEELFTTYPDLGGINVCSDEMASFNLGHVMSYGAPEERKRWIRRMVEVVEDACAKYGKRCYWNLHGCGDLYLDTLVEIGKSRSGGLRLSAESCPVDMVLSDNFPSYPFEKLAAAGDGMADHDVIIQYGQAFPWLPNILDHYIVRHVTAEMKAGLRGGGAIWWEDGPYYSPLNSLSAVNMELLSRLLWNPRESLDSIWERWLRRRFGQRAMAAAGRLLHSTQEVLNGIFFFNNTNAYFWFDFGFVWMWFYQLNMDMLMQAIGWYQMVEYFQPAGTPLYANPWNAACKERTIPMSQMRQEKQTAIRQAQQLLDYLIQHEADFAEADYDMLLPRYVALLYYARAAAQLTEVIYNFTNLHIRAYDSDCSSPREGMKQALDELECIYLEMLADARLRLFEPDVYTYGLRLWFMDHIPPALKDLRFYDRVLSAPETIDLLPTEQRDRACRILTDAQLVREKFERNARGEVDAEKEWARVLGDLVGDE